MKTKKLVLMISVLFASLITMTGCPGPLSFSGIRNPNVMVDGAGNSIVSYQVNEGETQITCIQKLGTNGEFQWVGKGITLYSEQVTSEGGGASALLVNSDNNSAILVWAQTDSIWTQKIDSEGHFLWGAGNVRVTSGTYILKAISDGLSGVVMAWSDDHDNLYLQRIDSQGNLLWSVNKPLIQTRPFDISCDGSGNTFLVWEDRDFNVLVQKLGSTGKLSWPSDALLLSDLHGPGVGMSRVMSDGAGGAIVVWIHGIRSENKVGITGHELYAQRIDSNGSILWQAGGVPVCTAAEGDRTVIAIEPRLVADESSGTIILWREMMSVYAQKVDANGNTLWAKNGIQIWNEEGAQGNTSSSVVSDDSGGAIVVWCYTPAGSATDRNIVLRAQRVSSDGQKLWGNNGILLSMTSPGYSFLPLISQDGHGGVIAAWAAGKNIHNAGLSYVQRVSAKGKLLWGNNGISPHFPYQTEI